MQVKNTTFNNIIASGTDNVVIPTAEQEKTGIVYKSYLNSNVPNGFFYNLSEAIQYLQFTSGLYDASANYSEGNISKILYKDASGYQLRSFRRNNKNSSVVKGNPPILNAVIETTNGIDCYSDGTANENWDEINNGLSAYIFQIENKTIDDLLDNSYTKDTIINFISEDKFNELYNACSNFTQIYFLDCFVSYKNCGEYSEGSEDTGDLKNYRFVELNIVKDGAINIYFAYNLTDKSYKTYYSQGIVASGNSLLNIQAVSSDLELAEDVDKSKVIPNMLAIAKINSDIQVLQNDTARELYVDLDLSLESNVKQEINLLHKVQELVPSAKKVNFWELVKWQSARKLRLEKDGWEDEYLLANTGSHDLANTDGELTNDKRYYASGLFLEGSFYSFAVNIGYRPSGSTKNGFTTIKSLQKDKSTYATATATAYANATAYASAYAYASANAYANTSAYAYAQKRGICYNSLSNTGSSGITRTLLATEGKSCQRDTANESAIYIDNVFTKNENTIYFKQEFDKVPIIVYNELFELKYTYKKLDKTKTNWSWETDFNNGDILYFKPKILVNYQ